MTRNMQEGQGLRGNIKVLVFIIGWGGGAWIDLLCYEKRRQDGERESHVCSVWEQGWGMWEKENRIPGGRRLCWIIGWRPFRAAEFALDKKDSSSRVGAPTCWMRIDEAS